MTDSREFETYEAKITGYAALQAEALRANRTALFQQLADAGIHTLVVSFDGCSDTGQIDSISSYDAEGGQAKLPKDAVEIRHISFENLTVSTVARNPAKVIEDMAYDFLTETHDGWENEDVAFGDFTFAIPQRSISLDYNERYTASTNYTHEL